ncbi:MAG: DUF3014 domain-containing protein [Proteobacteria bacterium]|nr:DUF3014 domain-containing protein [Pseudomonadota bacterium]
MKQAYGAAGAIILAVAVGAGGYLGWSHWRAAQAPDMPAAASAPQPPASPSPPPVAAPAAEPAVRYPLAAASAAVPADPDAAVRSALAEALGDAMVRRYVVLDDFAHRVAATVDGLPASASAARWWPVMRTPERFLVEQRADGATVVAPANAARYRPFVAAVEAAGADRIVGAYRQLYPLLQAAYEALGYPGRYFNDRVVAVIDHLLETPVPSGPIAVRLPEINAAVQPTRPWVRYEFVDASLEARSAGQKCLLRMGPDNERRLKAELAAIRRLLTQGAPAR